MKKHLPKIVVILGPTAVGKSDIAVQLAKQFKGEIVSADSRQVYKGLTIGTGKITRKEMKGIKHHLIDVADPKKRFTVTQYVTLAKHAVDDILSRGKLPIICGGTGFYISALVDGISLPDLPPNKKLRAILSKKTASELFLMLRKLDPGRATGMDRNNARRIIRAIEVAEAFGKVPNISAQPSYNALKIGIALPKEELRKRITIRLFARIREGMIVETKRLHRQGLSWKRMDELGLEYRFLAKYLNNKLSKDAMIKKLDTEIWQYARRQMTWFRRDKKIKWFSHAEIPEIKRRVEKLL